MYISRCVVNFCRTTAIRIDAGVFLVCAAKFFRSDVVLNAYVTCEVWL